jgi:hypothetical protein
MSTIKSLWASVQNDPTFMRKVNGWLTVFWIIMIPFAFFLGWLESVTFVSALSLWALVSGHWSAWQAARTEVRQKEQDKADTEGRIVKRILKETDLHSSSAKKKKN